MEIANYIKEYLYKQDYLDVGSLGTFFLSRDPFSVDLPQQKIRPTHKQLIFRANAEISGDHFIHFIARRKQISIEDSGNLVRHFIGEIQSNLNRLGSVEIPGFGKFSGSLGNSLEFKAYPHNYSSISFGLGELNLPPLEKKTDFIGNSSINESRQDRRQDELRAFSDYKPFGVSLTGDLKPGPSLNEFYSSSKAVNDPPKTDFSFTPETSTFSTKGIETNIDHYLVDQVPENIGNQDSISSPTTEVDNLPNYTVLPTAEDIYHQYGYKKPPSESEVLVDSTEDLQPASTLESNFPDSPEKIISQEPHLEDSLTRDLVAQNSTQTWDSNVYDSSEKILVNDPLEYSDLPYKPVNVQTESPHYTSYPIDSEDDSLPESRSKAWIWILTGIVIIISILGIAYVEKDKLPKKWLALFTPASEELNNTKVNTPNSKDSLTHTNTGINDSANSVSSQDSAAQISGDSNQKISDSSLLSKGPISSNNGKETPNESDKNEIVKEIENSSRYLILCSSFHLKSKAIKEANRLIALGSPAFVVHFKGSKLWIYRVSIGEFTDKQSAEKSLQETINKPAFKNASEVNSPIIYTNRLK